jgi:hypothetical protein
MNIFIGLFFLTLSVAADAILTSKFVSIHGLEAEANPIIRWIIESAGMDTMILFKIMVVFCACHLLAIYHSQKPKPALIIIWSLILIHVPIIYAGWELVNLKVFIV